MIENLIGQTFGYLTILQSFEEKPPWAKQNIKFDICKCKCGVIKKYYRNNITRGVSTSCGCKRVEMHINNSKTNRKLISNDLKGKHIGKSIIQNIKAENKGYHVSLKCECGNEYDIKTNFIKGLLKKKIPCPVCYAKNDSKYIGSKFGKLTIKSVYMANNNQIAMCECDCGNEKGIRLHSLVRGVTTSCGCRYRKVQLMKIV